MSEKKGNRDEMHDRHKREVAEFCDLWRTGDAYVSGVITLTKHCTSRSILKRDRPVEIKITPEMIRAGVDSFYVQRHDLNVSPSSLMDIFETALREALWLREYRPASAALCTAQTGGPECCMYAEAPAQTGDDGSAG